MGHGSHDEQDKPPPNPAAAAGLVRTSVVNGVRVVELLMPSELDSDAFDALNAALLIEVGTVGTGACVLDLTAVEYMGSSMLGLMVNARQRVKTGGGRLVLCGLSEWLLNTFRASSLERLFVTAVSRAAAMKSLGR